MSGIRTAREVAGLGRNGATVVVNSSSGLLCPDAILRILGEWFEDEFDGDTWRHLPDAIRPGPVMRVASDTSIEIRGNMRGIKCLTQFSGVIAGIAVGLMMLHLWRMYQASLPPVGLV